jgi:mono/diheme cytochrome c family protein
MLVVYLGIGVAVPAIILASRGVAQGATSKLETKSASAQLQKGKTLFRATCASCHTLAAVNARGVTGPDLDRIGKMTPARVLSGINIGGTGEGRKPRGLLTAKYARDVALFVSTVADSGSGG